MADRNDARSEFNPKYRVAGAIVLVALVVVFVPMILHEREPPRELKDGAAEPAPKAVSDTTLVTVAEKNTAAEVPEASVTTSKTVTVPVVIDRAPLAETKPSAPVVKPIPVKQTMAQTAHEKPAPLPAAAEKITKGWIVQVGTFSNSENASQLRNKLKDHGHAVRTETVTLAGKKATRLRVGPFREQQQAAKVQNQINKETGVQAAVHSYP